MFVTLEGPDGSGKTTQAHLLAEYLRTLGCDVVLTREPGGTDIGDQIRAVLHDPKNDRMDACAEVLLYAAARAQHVAERIRPALADNKIVISDRYVDSTLAYQGYGRGIDLQALATITEFATGGLWPDVTVYIDISPADGLQRRLWGGEEWNRLDAQTLDFHMRVRAGYYELIRQEPGRWHIVNGAAPVQEVHGEIRRLMVARLKATGVI